MVRWTRRHYVSTLLASGVTVLAGCSGENEGKSPTSNSEDTKMTNESPSDATPGSTTPTNTVNSAFQREQAGAIKSNSVNGLQIVGWTSTIPDESSFSVTVVVKNTGTATTDATEYGYLLYLYSDSGEETGSGGTWITGKEPTVAPGETTKVRLTKSIDNPDAVSTYKIEIFCARNFNGTYCE